MQENGVHEATVAGKTRRLRISLEAIREVEIQTQQPFVPLAIGLTDRMLLRFGDVLVMFSEFCAAGGTPLTKEERAALTPRHLDEIVPAVTEACIAEGILERLPTEPTVEAPEKKEET